MLKGPISCREVPRESAHFASVSLSLRHCNDNSGSDTKRASEEHQERSPLATSMARSQKGREVLPNWEVSACPVQMS